LRNTNKKKKKKFIGQSTNHRAVIALDRRISGYRAKRLGTVTNFKRSQKIDNIDSKK